MSQFVRNFLSNEDRAANVVVGGAVAVMFLSFVVAVTAILVLR